MKFSRVSEPKLNDIPCNNGNPFHVTADGALTRADVAADAGQLKTAFCWAGVAAVGGDAEGQYIMGAYLRKGIATRQNSQDALAWMIASAKQGHLDAMRTLVQMYQNGDGTQPNQTQARYWYDAAQQQQREDQARQLLSTLRVGPPDASPPRVRRGPGGLPGYNPFDIFNNNLPTLQMDITQIGSAPPRKGDRAAEAAK